jgi:hypothetical protein
LPVAASAVVLVQFDRPGPSFPALSDCRERIRFIGFNVSSAWNGARLSPIAQQTPRLFRSPEAAMVLDLRAPSTARMPGCGKAVGLLQTVFAKIADLKPISQQLYKTNPTID